MRREYGEKLEEEKAGEVITPTGPRLVMQAEGES